MEYATQFTLILSSILLAIYENANTLSSGIRFPQRIIGLNKKKPGQKEGHECITRANDHTDNER